MVNGINYKQLSIPSMKHLDNGIKVKMRVLRKRIAPKETVEELDDTVLNKTEHNILIEHSYFRVPEKKSCRWPDSKNASKVSAEYNTDYSKNCFSLPYYLKGFKSSSDEETEDSDNELKPLSLLLKIEFAKDLRSKKFKNTRASNRGCMSKRNLVCSKKRLKRNFMLDNCHNYSSVPQDTEGSISGARDGTTGVENHETIMSTCSNNTTNPKNQNINEYQTMLISDSLNDCTFEKSNAENSFTNDDFTSIEDPTEDSQNNLVNSPLECTNNIAENSESSEENLESLRKSPIIVIKSSLLPENVSPPFEWYQIIYLAIKNAPNECVTCQDIQCFSRRWFPFFIKKSWITDINSTLNYYKDTFFISFPLSVEFDNVWTVKRKSVNLLNLKVMSVVEQFENAIKSSMKNPDELSSLLKGYGVFNLGYKKQKQLD